MDRGKFSPNGELLSVCGSDGRLRIWSTKDKSGTLLQEFVPSAHLSATINCVEWAPNQCPQGGSEKRRKKRRAAAFEGDLLALGSAAGSLLFYSVGKSSLVAHSGQEHGGEVTGLAWSPLTLSLYSCGQDGLIVEWDVERAKSVSRWKGGKGPLSAICIFKDQLLCSGQGIALWNLETKTNIMNFMGQPNAISQMEHIPNTDYFVTLSNREMHLQIWSKTEKSSVATLMLTETPRNFCVLSSSEDGKVSIAAATEKGSLATFHHKLNGHLRKPLLPNCFFKIMDSNETTVQIPVLSSLLIEGNEIKLVYGSWLRLRFESMTLKCLESNPTIKREFNLSKASKVSKKQKKELGGEGSLTEIPADAKHLTPGSEAGLKPADSKAKKRKKSGGDKGVGDELPMEDRLSNLTIDKPSSGAIPDGSNLAHLLSQGLHSKDNKILASVLSRWDEDVIENTVRSLPVQLVVPLLNEVKKTLTNKPMMNHSVVKWLKTIFKVHSAFLMNCPSSEELLGPFLGLLHSRETLYPRMCQLKGKLELIKGNVQAKEHKAEAPNEALLNYHDESSDDGEDDDMIPSESEEFIGSDDLIEDDDESSNSDDDQENSSAEDDSSSNDEDDKATTTAKPKVNGRLSKHEESDEDESMDED